MLTIAFFFSHFSKPWEHLFVRKTSSTSGYISSLFQLKQIVTEYELNTCSKFSVFKTDKLFGKEEDLGILFLYTHVHVMLTE